MEDVSNRTAIALVGMACRYPDAGSPDELWQNVLAQRRAFRRMPAQRLRLADYFSADRGAEDALYIEEAALIEGYRFDRERFRVAGPTFRATDPAHWLALDVASQALADAGWRPEELPRQAFGVLVGNTLTGDHSRAASLRLRWPYVRRTLAAALAEEGLGAEKAAAVLGRAETLFKAPFPATGEDSLAGGLSNTIAGRIANHFDLHGGGYTVDGACASSLLAVIQACSALASGDLDCALAGGVDLSLDPFELVGFAKAGALASGEMRVYDAHGDGFLPGEGCGFVVLMRLADALAEGRRVVAVIRGWGVSSDGSGGITRPEVEGQLLALERAYGRAGWGADTVSYFEGHGTGTRVGDETELRALTRLRRKAGASSAAAVGSIKANIGHTKAAAGLAGLLKASLALHHGVLPPNTGCEQPHPELVAEQPMLRVLERGEAWGEGPRRAGVSAMGFGGINTHLALEGVGDPRPEGHRFFVSAQDAELFLLAAADAPELALRVKALAATAAGLSRAEMADLSAHLADDLAPGGARLAVVAKTPAGLARRLRSAAEALAEGVTRRLDADAGLFLAIGQGAAPRLGLLFPGQGAPSRLGGGLWRRRFEAAEAVYDRAGLPEAGDGVATEVAQPAILAAGVVGLRLLEALGLEARVALGHSLGELGALFWAGSCGEEDLLALARARGAAMAARGDEPGAMAHLALDADATHALVHDAGAEGVVVACLNGPRKTVVSGPEAAVLGVLEVARGRGVRAGRLEVSNAFHSPLVAGAARPLARFLEEHPLAPPRRRVFSTVTGRELAPEDDLGRLLVRQLTSPVRWLDALRAAAGEVDLWLEVGPGRSACALAEEGSGVPALSLDVGGPSVGGLLRAVGAAFVLGAPLRTKALFENRLVRPFDPERVPLFFESPCEAAPVPEEEPVSLPSTPAPAVVEHEPPTTENRPALEVLRSLVAERVELPVSSVGEDHHLSGDLHLSSITVGQLMAEAARRVGLEPSAAPTEYADATVGSAARALEELRSTGGTGRREEGPPPGVDTWVRAFTVEWVPAPRDVSKIAAAQGTWHPAQAGPSAAGQGTLRRGPSAAGQVTLRRGPSAAGQGTWHLFAPTGHALAGQLKHALEALAPAGGVVGWLPSEPGEDCLKPLLAATRRAVDGASAGLLLVQHGAGFGAFARTLHLETGLPTVLVEVPDPRGMPDAAAVVPWIAAAVAGHDEGFAEIRFDAGGRPWQPVLRPLSKGRDAEARDATSTDIPLDPGDVLLVSGGGKGIGAECALALARRTGARLALLGRSPVDDPVLLQNLERFRAAGVEHRYTQADVTDAEAVTRAVAELEAALGPVRGILHSAGINHPRLLSELDVEDFRRTLGPKLHGFEHLLAATDPGALRLVVGFGSIIARTGMRGEADYGLANEWLRRRMERLARQQPECRVLDIEWSVWSGVGMGERLGRIDALLREGITPITPEEGVEIFLRLLEEPPPGTSVVVSGRGETPTLPVERGELPLGRFLERPRVHYPGIELVVEVELGGETDPYLEDHTYRGERLFPAVLGLEAMAQAAMALVGTETPPSFAKVRFERPIVVSPGQSLVLRIAALARQPDRVQVVLRTDASAFQVDHFRAECRFGESPAAGHRPWPEEGTVALDVHRDLYGGPLFQSGRFHRVAGYRALEARACRAEIAPAQGAVQWFGRFLPQALVLGDPGARDAALHGIQACIPHRTVLPVAVDRIELYPLPEDEGHHLEAREREQRGDLLIYDLDIHGSGGVERWQGLRLRAVAETPPPATWPPALLAPYLERTLAERFGAAGVRIGLVGAGEGREELVRRLAGTAEPTLRRSDGKSELADGRSLSLAHAGPLVLGVIGPETLGCDLEPVAERSPEVWADLLGPERRRLADVLGGDAEAATRVWTALECCKKAGLGVGVPLVVREQGDGWVVLGCGERVIATWCGRLAGQTVVAAVLYRPAPEDDTAAPRARPAASTRAPVEGAHAEL